MVLIYQDRSYFYIVRCVDDVNKTSKHRDLFARYRSKSNGKEPKGIDKTTSGTTGAPKLPEGEIVVRDLPLTLQCDMEQESIYPLDVKRGAKKGSEIDFKGDFRVGEIKGILRLKSIYEKRRNHKDFKFKNLYKLI